MELTIDTVYILASMAIEVCKDGVRLVFSIESIPKIH